MRVRQLVPLLVLGTACATEAEPNATSPACRLTGAPVPLPPGLEESSGLAASRRFDGVIWTHNDSGGEAVLTAVRASGEPIAQVRVAGARNRDWEDLALGPCPAGTCLYIGDIGDNEAERERIEIYRVPEPDPTAARGASPRAERLAARYPDGPRDAEALFVTPTGELYLVSKGGTEPPALYRYPPPFRPDRTVQLEHVVDLGSAPLPLPERYTGADASPDGAWVVLRSYRGLAYHPTDRLLGGDPRPARIVDLSALGQPQGEAVAVGADGTVVLTSEGGFGDAPGSLAVLACQAPPAS